MEPSAFAAGPHLWFAPEADFLESYTLELALADALRRNGAEDVVMVGCSGLLRPRCTAITARIFGRRASHSEQAAVCRRCITTRKAFAASGPLNHVSLEDFVEASDGAWIREQMSSVSHGNWRDFAIDGIPLGMFAAYQPLLLTKQDSVVANDEVWSFFLDELETLLRILRPFERMYAAIAPRAAYTMNQLYGSHRLFLRIAEDRGLPRWSASPGGLVQMRTQSAYFFPTEMSSQTMSISTKVNEARNLPLTQEEVSSLATHQRALVDGNDPWVYSAATRGLTPAEIRERLHVRPQSRVFTVLMSSPDEMRSAEAAGAELRLALNPHGLSLGDFVTACLEAAGRLPDADFVIRLHPRLFPNQRESTLSPDAERIVSMFDSAPENVLLCRPTDGISMYDNLLISDGAFNFTSSSGAEFLAFGVPVYHFDSMRVGAYPADLGIEVAAIDELVQLLEAPPPQELPLARILSVYLWWATQLCRTAVFLAPAGGTPAAATGQTQGSGIRTTVHRILPAPVKDAIGRFLEMRGRRRLTFPSVPALLQDEVHAQVAVPVPAGEQDPRRLWVPNIVVRGNPVEDQMQAVAASLGSVAQHLGWMALSEQELAGAGWPVRALLTRLRQGDSEPSGR